MAGRAMNDEAAQPQLAASPEILEAQRELVETFALLEDWTDRYQYIIDLGRQAERFPTPGRSRRTGCTAASRRSGS